MLIKTPSGYLVELKDKLTFGEMRELQKSLFQGIKGELGKMPEIEFTKLMEYAERAFPLLVKKIIKNGKEVTGDLMAEVNSWDSEDGEAVFTQVTAISQPAVDTKKK